MLHHSSLCRNKPLSRAETPVPKLPCRNPRAETPVPKLSETVSHSPVPKLSETVRNLSPVPKLSELSDARIGMMLTKRSETL